MDWERFSETTGERLRATARTAAPDAEESFSYGMPAYLLAGRPLAWVAAWVAAWKRHYSLYPVSTAQVAALAAPGDVYEAERGTIRFRVGAPLPYDLVARIVNARADEIAAGGC